MDSYLYAAEEAVKNGIIIKDSNEYKMYLADAYFNSYSEGDIRGENYLYEIEHINLDSVILGLVTKVIESSRQVKLEEVSKIKKLYNKVEVAVEAEGIIAGLDQRRRFYFLK